MNTEPFTLTKLNVDLIGTLAVCNDCANRFKCWTGQYGKALSCAAPYPDEKLREWKAIYPALERSVNIELAERKIQREIREIHERIKRGSKSIQIT